jgi:hypothetical protein
MWRWGNRPRPEVMRKSKLPYYYANIIPKSERVKMAIYGYAGFD